MFGWMDGSVGGWMDGCQQMGRCLGQWDDRTDWGVVGGRAAGRKVDRWMEVDG